MSESRHHKAKVQPTSGRNQVLTEQLEAQPHTRSHRQKGKNFEESKGDSNIFHDDEAFSRYEMGQSNVHGEIGKGTLASHAEQAVKSNHHARGGTKEGTTSSLRKEYMEDLHPRG